MAPRHSPSPSRNVTYDEETRRLTLSGCFRHASFSLEARKFWLPVVCKAAGQARILLPGPGPSLEGANASQAAAAEGGRSLGDRSVSSGGNGLDTNSVSHTPGSFLQELQIPVIADRGRLSRDSRPIEGASCSILAVLSLHLNCLSSKPDPEVSPPTLVPGLPESRRLFCPEVGGAR